MTGILKPVHKIKLSLKLFSASPKVNTCYIQDDERGDRWRGLKDAIRNR